MIRFVLVVIGLCVYLMPPTVVPTPIAVGYFIGIYGINAAFLLAGAFVLAAAFIFLPLDLYRGREKRAGA